MAWTAPITWVAGGVPTASLLNAQIRDNLMETMPYKATSVGSLFVGAGQNSIVERFSDYAQVTTAETTTSTSYVDLPTVGPSVTLNTGTRAMVFFSAQINNNTLDGYTYVSYAVTGATTIAAPTDDSLSLIQGGVDTGNPMSGGMVNYITNLNAGSNTFTLKYKVSVGTGNFRRRFIGVIPFS